MYVTKLNGTNFYEVKPAFYAREMGEKAKKDPAIWDTFFPTKEVSEFMKRETKGDFSKAWHERCSMCWEEIGEKTTSRCYHSEDKLTWLCHDCFHDLCNMPQNEVE